MKPGLYLDLPEEQYHADPADVPSLSSSIIKVLVADTPLHCWAQHPRLNPNFVAEEKEIFDLGSVAHSLMLQGLAAGHVIKATKKEGAGKNRVDTDIPVEDYRSKEAKEERAAARLAGKVPILAKQWDRVKSMVQAGKFQLAAHKEAHKAFSDGKPEVTIIWEDDGGVICRARLDWLKDDHKSFSDYKSTGMTANPDAISRSMFGNGWDTQEAFYRRGIRKLFGIDAVGSFICQEDSEPYALSAIGFGPDVQCIGDKKVQYAIDLWGKCLKENEWPGYPNRLCYPTLPPWIENQWLEKEMQNV